MKNFRKVPGEQEQRELPCLQLRIRRATTGSVLFKLAYYRAGLAYKHSIKEYPCTCGREAEIYALSRFINGNSIRGDDRLLATH